jgi:hypothetical protein
MGLHSVPFFASRLALTRAGRFFPKESESVISSDLPLHTKGAKRP